jgi:hypothetical protein|tara:strand:+ start:1352 stop:3178 length:1827 start_codon:yes stop_codon:yes gene_type:complete
MATCAIKVETELSGAEGLGFEELGSFKLAEFPSDTWTDITGDVLSSLSLSYGITGNSPSDVVASTGELQFLLRNDAGNSVTTQGAYSPLHANVRSGWTYGVPIRVVFTHGAATVFSVSSITRSGTTSTVTTGSSHGRATGDWVTIAGATPSEYNGTYQVTVTNATVFTYALGGSPSTPAGGTKTSTHVYIRFRGKVRIIAPEPGQYLTQRVRVTCYDAMRDLMESKVREIAIQIDKTEAELLTAVLDSLPFFAQPPLRSIETGIDTYPYAMDDVGGGTAAAGLIKNIVLSSLGIFFCKGDGTATYLTRHSRATGSSAYTFNNSMRIGGVSAPTSLEGVYNHVRTTIHPKTIDASASTVLFALTGTPPSIPAGESITLWGDFRDPDEVKRLIGGTAVVDPLVENTDYDGNAAANGSGTDLSSSLSIAITPYASTCKFVVTNNHASSTIYLVNSSGATKLQVRGKGIYDDGPQTFEAVVSKVYGDRPVSIDLPYQDDGVIGQSAATYLEAQYDDLEDQVNEIVFLGNDSDDLMTQALAREPGDLVTITESLTGLSGTGAMIQSVSHDVTLGSSGPRVIARFGLAPASPYTTWQIGTVGNSEIGNTTTLGF